MERKAGLRLLAALLAGAGAIAMIWPGDAPWISDEPMLIALALRCLESGRIAAHGIVGSRGVLYGPFAVWVYAILLLLTRNLIALVSLHAFLFAAACAAAIVWIAALCSSLVPALGALALLSPYFWFYSRLLWDNPFLIPLSWLTVAAYVSFCARRESWKLLIAALGCAFMFLTHLMSLALIGALAVHASWAHRRWLAARAGLVAGLLGLAALICGPYALALAGNGVFGVSPPHQIWQGMLFPFFGARLFSASGLEYFFGADWSTPAWVTAAGLATWVALPLAWLGMGLSLRRVKAGLKSSAARGADFHMGLLGWLTILCQSLLYGALRTYGHPHYYDPAWVFHFYFLWTGLSAPAKGSWRAALAALRSGYALALAAVLAFAVLDIHRSGGNRNIHYGPTLANQIEIARNIARYSPASPLSTTTLHYRLFPYGLVTLFDVYGLKQDERGPYKRLSIRYRDPGSADGRVILAEAEAL